MSRVEKILQHILDGTTPMEPSMSRVEYILKAIAGESDTYGVPLSRVEKLLQKWHGDDVELEPPQSRIEKLLYILAGETIEAEQPMSRIEELLLEIAENTDTVLAGLVFDGDCWLEIPVFITGADTVSFTYLSRATSNNVIGSYTDSSADNNFSYYHGNTFYARYGNQLARSSARTNTEYEISMGPNGLDINDDHYDFEASEFVCETALMIGKLPNSNQPMLKGYLLGPIIIGNRMRLVPVRTEGGDIGYRDRATGILYTNRGTGTLLPYE